MSHLPVATEILRQLGGAGRLTAMIGARNFVGSQTPDGLGALSFQFAARARDGIKGVRVVLEATDTYRVEFVRAHRRVDPAGSGLLGYKLIREFSGVYCDQLRRLIESTTGLALSL